jgi:hypothetical protein|tara:strand:+ start:409 stop:891 length:483 start_codon:yes stop_codon:yes gene_type:complete
MAYKGRYRVKNPEKYSGDHTQVIFRSLWERHCFRWCDVNPKVKSWSSEEVVIPYLYEVDKRPHRYFIDLKISFEDGKTILVEVKPDKETKPPTGSRRTRKFMTEAATYVKNMNKWEAADNYAKDRGWEFQIWTEKTLTSMGIMPKSTKPLKPFKRRKKSV